MVLVGLAGGTGPCWGGLVDGTPYEALTRPVLVQRNGGGSVGTPKFSTDRVPGLNFPMSSWETPF